MDLCNNFCPHPRTQPEILNRMNFFILLDLLLLLSSSTTWLITGVIGGFLPDSLPVSLCSTNRIVSNVREPFYFNTFSLKLIRVILLAELLPSLWRRILFSLCSHCTNSWRRCMLDWNFLNQSYYNWLLHLSKTCFKLHLKSSICLLWSRVGKELKKRVRNGHTWYLSPGSGPLWSSFIVPVLSKSC